METGEDFIAALHREVTEETGLVIAEVTDYLGQFDYTSGSGKHTRQHTWSVTVSDIEDVALTEHDAYEWVAAAPEGTTSAEVNELIKQHFRSGTGDQAITTSV